MVLGQKTPGKCVFFVFEDLETNSRRWWVSKSAAAQRSLRFCSAACGLVDSSSFSFVLQVCFACFKRCSLWFRKMKSSKHGATDVQSLLHEAFLTNMIHDCNTNPQFSAHKCNIQELMENKGNSDNCIYFHNLAII